MHFKRNPTKTDGIYAAVSVNYDKKSNTSKILDEMDKLKKNVAQHNHNVAQNVAQVEALLK